MFEGRIKALGEKLSNAFTERARHYFTQASSEPNPGTKSNFNLMGATLGEIGNIILKVTTSDGD